MGSLYDEAMVALHGIWRQRWLALAVGWGVALLGWLVIGLIPNTYKSEARVLIQAQSLLPDKVGISANERAASMEGVRQNLLSAQSLQAIVRTTGLAKHVSTEAEVDGKAGGLARAITITAEQDNLFKITATASERSMSDAANAKLAKDIVERLIDLFADGSAHDGRQETGQSVQFLDGQIAARGKALAEAEARRAAFEAKYLTGLPGTGPIADRVAAARTELTRLEGDLAAAQSALAAVNGQMAATPASTTTPGVMIPGAPGTGSSRVGAIEAQIAEGQSRGWTDSYPDMVSLRRQLSAARAAGSGVGGGTSARMSAGTSAPNPMYVSLRSMQAEKQATAGALAARKAQIQGEIERVATLQATNPEFAAEQAAVDGSYQVLRAQYDKLVADREDLRLRGDVQARGNAVKFEVLDGPTAPRVPATPNRPLLLTLVLLAAIGAGVGAAFARGQLQTTYPTAARLERASGLPVLGSITEVVRAPERAVRSLRLKQFAGGTAALVGLWAVLMVVEFVQRGMIA